MDARTSGNLLEGSHKMSIQDEQELLSLKSAGRIVRQVLDAMKAEVRLASPRAS